MVSDKRLPKIFYLSLAFKILLISFFVYAFVNFENLWVLWSFLIIIVSFIPIFLNRVFKMPIPWLLDFLVTIALLLHLGNGLFDASEFIPLYNKFTHFFSSLILAFIVLFAMYLLDRFYRTPIQKIFFDVIVVTMALGVVWEFLEWTSDILFDLNAQPSLQDTMLDLLADTLGGILMAFIGIYLIRKGILKNLTKDFKEYIHSNFEI